MPLTLAFAVRRTQNPTPNHLLSRTPIPHQRNDPNPPSSIRNTTPNPPLCSSVNVDIPAFHQICLTLLKIFIPLPSCPPPDPNILSELAYDIWLFVFRDYDCFRLPNHELLARHCPCLKWPGL
uniref:Uncharacterized protein n=1 Tax=Schistocephalus solidus TaxID=70667 RepID=A0A0X3NV25_SCHSO